MWYIASMSRNPNFDVIVVFGDLHIPYQDEKAVSLLIQSIQTIRPDALICAGDGFDFYQLSRFTKDPKRRLELAKDRKVFVRVMREITAAAPKKARKIYLAGNHEARLQHFLSDNAPELHGLEEFEMATFLKLDELGWDYHENSDRRLPIVRLGDLSVTHGHRTNEYAHKWTMNDYGESVLVQHTHRLGSYFHTGTNGTIEGWQNGHLFDEDKATYTQIANWQKGFSVVTVENETGWFRVEQVAIKKVPGTSKLRVMLHEGIIETSGNIKGVKV
jgi:hypothetical protein